jgi:hypothetical protein
MFWEELKSAQSMLVHFPSTSLGGGYVHQRNLTIPGKSYFQLIPLKLAYPNKNENFLISRGIDKLLEE